MTCYSENTNFPDFTASNKMFNSSLNWFTNLTNRTLQTFPGTVYPLIYERLKENMHEELTELARFLDVPLPSADAIKCTVLLQEGNFHRKTDAGKRLKLMRAVYTPDKLQRLRSATRDTEQMLERYFKRKFYVGGDREKVLFT